MFILTTQDGSHTLFSEQFNEVYHSRKGAIEESKHVFLKQGFDFALKSLSFGEGFSMRLFEVGFGTGLNALLTMLEAEKQNVAIHYETIEPFPLPIETIKDLNYTQQLGYELCYGPYHSLHLCRWNEWHEITKYFSFKKNNESLITFLPQPETYNLIYFDAFAPEYQPEMWTKEILKKMFEALMPEGILVTYCSKVSVQRTLKEVGFSIEKMQGPHGRREMLLAKKVL